MSQEESTREYEYEPQENLLGFFSLLLEIDKRLNPQNYELSDEETQNA